MEINVPAISPRQPQPTSFPFLFVIAILFYFFSKSPSAPSGEARIELERTLDRRRQEVVGLRNWLNSSIDVGGPWLKLLDGSNFTQSPVSPSLCYPLNQTYGIKPIYEAQRFVSDWLSDIDHRMKINTPRLYRRNITGNIRGEWRVRSESTDWYPTQAASASVARETTNTSVYNNTLDHASSNYGALRGNFPWTSRFSNETLARPQRWKLWPSYSPQKVGFSFKESRYELMPSNSSTIRGSMYISAPDSKDVNLQVEGIHFQETGIFYLRAWPGNPNFDPRVHLSSALDIPSSYHNVYTSNKSLSDALVPTEQQRRIGEVIMSDLLERMRNVQAMLKKGDITHEAEENDGDASPNCTFIIYGSLLPLPTTDTQTAESLLEYENSLSNPTGASISTPVPSRPLFQSLMISPNCGLVLESNEMSILLSPEFWSKGRMYGYVAGLVMGAQCLLLVWQMDGRQSPSSLSRISYFSLVTQIIMDAWTFSSHLTLSVVTNNLSSQMLLVPAFFACLNAILFGMRYGTLIRIYTPVETSQNRDQNSTGDTIGHDADYVQVPTAVNELQAPEASPSGAQPTRRSSSILRTGVFFRNLFIGRPLISVGLITVTLLTVPFMLYRWQPLILFALYSYWIPQIFHNVQHGTSRRGLRKRYVVGTTMCRLFLPLYIWGCPNNVLFVEPNPWIWLLCLYSLLQAAILVLQDWLGARFFLFGACSPYEPIWDYHPIKLPHTSDLENGANNGLEKMPECVICFEPIDVLPISPVTGHDDRSSMATEVGLFSRWSYMVPPCHHIAHTKCLENWLAIKSECPVCRRTLPPI
ncbi:hypothetical protein BY996DRAFT_6656961 [Phakopsora pachyrhizi]|uniref:RING-type E3 ubiquitin transferase n=1 Tax=Phakopsora pachyrhizi TaxID=170000 RepID=A0AAV0BCU1_PHAPC|nr:hypothetical protein BY996DRAFT_6656961 [Phakopsora pachyrhizi]CAH7685150.1 hypothetical protein PPACK8108_LOCUS19630 [Phakopsora pachyrhizi]